MEKLEDKAFKMFRKYKEIEIVLLSDALEIIKEKGKEIERLNGKIDNERRGVYRLQGENTKLKEERDMSIDILEAFIETYDRYGVGGDGKILYDKCLELSKEHLTKLKDK